MTKGQMNLQDVFLNQVRKERIPVTIYLIGGVQLKGQIRGFDSFTVMLDSPGKPTQIVYKHASFDGWQSPVDSCVPKNAKTEGICLRLCEIVYVI